MAIRRYPFFSGTNFNVAPVSYYETDTASELPVPGSVIGDIAYARDTNAMYFYGTNGWASMAGGSGGGGAPADATYVTLSTNATLTNERVLTAGSGITLTDGGAGSTLTIAASGSSGWALNGNTVTSEKWIGTIDAFDFPMRSFNVEGARLHNTLDSDGTTKLVNFLVGRTTQSDVVEPFSYKLPIDVLRDHNQSTYMRIENTINGTHAISGYIAATFANAQIIVSAMSPLGAFGDMRNGGAAAIQVSGCTELDIFTEDNAPINFGVNDTKYWWISVDGSLNARGVSFADQTAVAGFISFDGGVTTNSSLRLNSRPILTGVASPDGGSNSMQVAGSHLIVGTSTSDAATFRGLIMLNSDGTALAEFAGYNGTGTPYVELYIGGYTVGNIVMHYTQALATVKVNLLVDGGIVVAGATGGQKGAGTINVAADIYKNNTAYTNPDYAFEHWAIGKIDKFINNDGAKRYKGRMNLDELEQYCRKNLRLPGISDEAMGMFSRSDFVLEKIEELFTYMFDLNKRVESGTVARAS